MGHNPPYRGRIAPTPTGYLHLGHAATFTTAWERARAAGGCLIYRDEDLDPQRCREEYKSAALRDLRDWGLDWDEGPDLGGPHHPYIQSERTDFFLQEWKKLLQTGLIYPSPHSRKDIEEAVTAPQEGVAEVLFPLDLRPNPGAGSDAVEPGDVNWRFRVPDGETIRFHDECAGDQEFIAGKDFGDFLIWRKDGVPSYEFAVVTDDIAMGITEVVRGEDLLLSTARQLLLYRAFQAKPPKWYHCPLIRDQEGKRLAKRSQSLALKELLKKGFNRENPPARKQIGMRLN